MPSHPPLVKVNGTPRKQGRQYGEQASSRIRLGIDHYSVQLERDKLSWQGIREITARYEPTVARFEPNYIEEMHGIAEGAGVEFAAVLLLNARTELLKLAQWRQSAQPMPSATAVAIR
jgi:isopenicillin-N N-acyltransferase-like protein